MRLQNARALERLGVWHLTGVHANAAFKQAVVVTIVTAAA